MDSYHAKATTGGVLPALVSKCRTSQLVPESFFIAWNGVLVLVFRKFTSSILSLKAEIDSSLESVICKENPGSKYPKSTIAALADNEQLSLEEFTKLRLLALSYRDKLSALEWPVTSLSIVQFANRALSQTVCTTTLRLQSSSDPSLSVSSSSSSSSTSLSTSSSVSSPCALPRQLSDAVNTPRGSALSVMTEDESAAYTSSVLAELHMHAASPFLSSSSSSSSSSTSSLAPSSSSSSPSISSGLSEGGETVSVGTGALDDTLLAYLPRINPTPSAQHSSPASSSSSSLSSSSTSPGPILPSLQPLPGRISHYTAPAIGSTLVSFLHDESNSSSSSTSSDDVDIDVVNSPRQRVLDVLDAFERDVDLLLPGKYVFLPRESLHVTIRGLT